MPFPVSIDLARNDEFTRWTLSRNKGPFQYLSKFFIFQTVYDGNSSITAYRSMNGGETWTRTGEDSEPYVGLFDTTGGQDWSEIGTCYNGNKVVVAFVRMADVLRLSFCEFNMATETWGSVVEGPQVFEPGEEAGGPFYADGISDVWGYFYPSVVARSTGELVFMIDSHEEEATIDGETRFFRQVSLYTYNGGTWSSRIDPFDWEVGGFHREHMPGNLVLGSDNRVFVFAVLLGWIGGYPYSGEGVYDLENMGVEYVPLGADNVLGTHQTITIEPQIGAFVEFAISTGAVIGGQYVYVAYRSGNTIKAVRGNTNASGYIFTSEVTVATINSIYYEPLNAAMVMMGETPYLVWTDHNVAGTHITLNYSKYTAGTWSAPVTVVNLIELSEEVTRSVENFTAAATSSGIGMMFFYGSLGGDPADFPLSYYQWNALGGGPISRYRAR